MEGTELSKSDASVTEEVDTEAERNMAEAEKLRQEARQAAASATIRELELKWKQDEDRERERTKPVRDGAYIFNAEVSDYSVARLLSHLAQVHRDDPTADMRIELNSPGGSVFDGAEAADTIYGYSLRGGGTHKVTITVRGMAASMAGILLQYADERVMGATSFLMIHEAATHMGFGKTSQFVDEVTLLKALGDQAANLFVERSGGKITRKKFDALTDRKDFWVPAVDALKYGFVDRIG